MRFSARTLSCLMVALAFFILDNCQASDTSLGAEEVSKSSSINRHSLAQDLVQKLGALDFFKKTCSGGTATSFNSNGEARSLKVHIDFERMVRDLGVLYANSFDEAELCEMVSIASYNMKIDKENPVHMKMVNTLIAFQQTNLYRPAMSPLGIYLTLSEEETPPPSSFQKETIQNKEKTTEKF